MLPCRRRQLNDSIFYVDSVSSPFWIRALWWRKIQLFIRTHYAPHPHMVLHEKFPEKNIARSIVFFKQESNDSGWKISKLNLIGSRNKFFFFRWKRKRRKELPSCRRATLTHILNRLSISRHNVKFCIILSNYSRYHAFVSIANTHTHTNTEPHSGGGDQPKAWEWYRLHNGWNKKPNEHSNVSCIFL